MSKTIYHWDAQNHFNGVKIEDDDYQLSGNETLTAVPQGLYEPITWTGSSWQGTSKEDYSKNQAAQAAAQPTQPAKPSDQQVLNARVLLQLGQLSQKVDKLEAAVDKNQPSQPTQPTQSTQQTQAGGK